MFGPYGRHYVVPSWRLFDATGKVKLADFFHSEISPFASLSEFDETNYSFQNNPTAPESKINVFSFLFTLN